MANMPVINYVESHDQAFVGSCTLFQSVAKDSSLKPADLSIEVSYNVNFSLNHHPFDP